MSQPLFRGAITALITPFRDGRVDTEAFASLVERQIAAGIHGLVPVGTTGETSTLSHDEHKEVVELCVKVASGRVPVIAGDDSSCLGYMAHGGQGVISVTSNVAPEAMASMMNACLSGDWTTALYWNDRLAKLHTALFLDSSPSPTKFALSQMGLCAED